MKFHLGSVMLLMFFGMSWSIQSQNLSPMVEPCVTGPDCRCACTLQGKPCPCIKKCATEPEKTKELVP